MAQRAAKPCRRPGCPELVRGQPYCLEHQQASDRQRDQQRGSRHERGYGNDWARVSRLVIQRDGGICHLCGQPGADTADHVRSKRRGGGDELENLAAAHRRCNSAKGGR